MTQPTGIHHIAIMAANIKKHIDFFASVMGCPLVAMFDMHGVPGGIHAFLRLQHGCYFSIVQLPEAAEAHIQVGVTHAGSGAKACAPGTLQHLAFAVDDETALLSLRDRLRSHGINVFGPINHGFCKSIYFAGPDQLTLEVATSLIRIDPRAWIDPATLAAADISPEEVEQYRSPTHYSGPSPVPQPPYDPAKPHQAIELDRYRELLAMSDEEYAARAAYAPPVEVLG
jgi:catechol 2,3-dioxygenase-like lactoylglutathione lyase family enzyme